MRAAEPVVVPTHRSSPTRTLPRPAEWGLLLAIVCVGAVLRLWALDSLPPGLNQDEAASGYDAWALLHHGIDRNGMRHPVYLISWGSGQYALYAYLCMPWIALLGLEPLAVRLPNALLGIASLPLLFAFARRIADAPTALVATALLAISPWAVLASRIAVDANAFPPILLAGAWLLAASAERPWRLPAAFALFALALYAYGTAFAVVPAFLGLGCAYLWWGGRLQPVPLAVACGAFALLALPSALYLGINFLQLESIETPLFTIPRLPGVPRFTAMAAWNAAGGAGAVVQRAWSLVGMMVVQSDGLLWNVVPGYGYAYHATLPLAAVGLAVAARRAVRSRAHDPAVLVLAWLAAALLLAATLREYNFTRLNAIFVPIALLAAVGIVALYRAARSVHRKAPLAVAVVVAAAYLWSFQGFCRTYFGPYRESVGPVFFESFPDAVAAAARSTDGPICVTDRVNMPYIFVLFATTPDPRTFVESVQYVNPGDTFQRVRRFDRYTFGTSSCTGAEDAYVLTAQELARAAPGAAVWPFKQYVVVVPEPRREEP
jgi:4-amino-4-deoxy-L-arabinose transferase-like glycosyltransferase